MVDFLLGLREKASSCKSGRVLRKECVWIDINMFAIIMGDCFDAACVIIVTLGRPTWYATGQRRVVTIETGQSPSRVITHADVKWRHILCAGPRQAQ